MKWLADWWRKRGERRCQRGKHAWRRTEPPIGAFLMGIAVYLDYARCRRCGHLGQRVRD